MVDSPFDRVPSKAPRWDLADIEGYSGGNCVSWCSWMFSGYVGIYRRKKYVGGCPRAHETGGAPYRGGRPPISWLPRVSSDVNSKSPGSYSSKKSRAEGFIPFGLRLIFLFFEILK